MRKDSSLWAAILALTLAWMAGSGPVQGAAFAEISAALSAGDGQDAFKLAESGLAELGLSEADQARLVADRAFARNLVGDKEGARADFTQAIATKALTPQEQARLYLERGLILDGMSRFDDAIGDYDAALRLTPDSAPALNNRANIFRRQNRLEEARRDYFASLAAGNPAPEYSYFGLGRIAESEDKPQQARSFYLRALAANPGYALAAERLTALGGVPPPVETITLKPPQTYDAPLVLHLSAKQTAKPLPAVPAAKPAAPELVMIAPPDLKPGLRPALDNGVGDNGAREEVQLGAWRSQAEAEEGWKRALAQAQGALAGFSPHVVTADLPGKGRFYRLRVVTMDAGHLCATLTGLSQSCILVRKGAP